MVLKGCGLTLCTSNKFLNIICFHMRSAFREKCGHTDKNIITCVMAWVLIVKLDIDIWFYISISVTSVNVKLTLKAADAQYSEAISIQNLKTWELNHDKFIEIINALSQNISPSIGFPRLQSNLMVNWWSCIT